MPEENARRTFTARHRIEFAETDLAGIMHFSNYFRLMERTEHAFYRSIGMSVMMPHEGSEIGFPRVHAECDYRRPLRFEDEVDVVLTVREIREKSVVFDFIFQLASEETARGSITVACVRMEPNSMKPAPIPQELRNRLLGTN